MTAPTTPWTEAEVRQALTQSVGDGFAGLDNTTQLLDVVLDSDMARVRRIWDEEFTPSDDHLGTLWADLRPDEEEDLLELMHGVLSEVEREATVMLIERATAAALAFQERHPEVPRGHWPLVRREAPTAA